MIIFGNSDMEITRYLHDIKQHILASVNIGAIKTKKGGQEKYIGLVVKK